MNSSFDKEYIFYIYSLVRFLYCPGSDILKLMVIKVKCRKKK